MSNYLIGTDPTLRKTKTPTVTTLTAGVGFTAGTSTAITLGADPGQEEHVIVTMDGVTQHRSTYAVSGTTLTFDAAIPTGTAEIEATFGVPVSSVTVPDDAVTLAKMASGTDGNIISYDTSGNPVAVATGTDGQVLTSSGAGAVCAFESLPASGFTQGTEQATTSGTSFTFGSIPAGVDMIVINFNEVSLSGSDYLEVTLGDSGGLETTGYEGTRAGLNNTSHAHNNQDTCFPIQVGSASEAVSGMMWLTLQDAANFTWVQHHMIRKGDYNISFGAGFKALSAELTQVSLTRSGSNTFDAGGVNIMYI